VRALSRGQRVVSMMVYRWLRASGAGGDVDVKHGELLAGHALQPTHEPYSHALPLPCSNAVATAERVFPVLSLGIGVLAAVIVARRNGKSSATFAATVNSLKLGCSSSKREQNDRSNHVVCCVATAAKS
jgi:hypothetical protein